MALRISLCLLLLVLGGATATQTFNIIMDNTTTTTTAPTDATTEAQNEDPPEPEQPTKSEEDLCLEDCLRGKAIPPSELEQTVLQCEKQCLVHRSNPLEQGCFYNKLPEWTRKRVCNSEDDPDSTACDHSHSLDYTEVRLYFANWESAMFLSWLHQIILSELLGVPTSTEPAAPGVVSNLYHPSGSFEYGTAEANRWADLEASNSYPRSELDGDCTLASKDPDNYHSCAHVFPEHWAGHYYADLKNLTEHQVIEPAQAMGMVALEGWYVPKFTLQRDPTLSSYFGLSGQHNRRKLAERFKRPTTWKDYCEEVSPNNCAEPDDVAQRAPTEAEEGHMFVDGLYTGHFRATEENDCDLHPDTCTGHIVDWPCDWTSYLKAQAYHLDIAMASSGESGVIKGYGYMQMHEIWMAANATKSDVAMYYWEPEGLYNIFRGTDAEMTKIALPAPSQECLQNRYSSTNLCDMSTEITYGDPLGACDADVNLLKQLVSSGLYGISHDPDVPKALHSPAYQAVTAFSMSTLQMNEVFANWLTAASARDAVCTWAVDHMEILMDRLPRSYPRKGQPTNQTGAMMYITVTVSCLAALMVVAAGVGVYVHRKRPAIRRAQPGFLAVLLLGAFLVAVGALVRSIPPEDASCVLAIWFINVGYSLELIPLVVKVSAVNRLMAAAKKMRRVKLNLNHLYIISSFLTGLMLLFLTFWTALDMPRKEASYQLTGTTEVEHMGFGVDLEYTLVEWHYHCASESQIWSYVAVAWNAILLFWATVLAFQMRNAIKVGAVVPSTQSLVTLIYQQTVFLLFRLVTYFLKDSVNEVTLASCQSLIYAVDTIMTVLIYFVPKFNNMEDKKDARPDFLTRMVSSISRPNNPTTDTAFMSSGIDASALEQSDHWKSGAPTLVSPFAARNSMACSSNRQEPSTLSNSSGHNRAASRRGALLDGSGSHHDRPGEGGEDIWVAGVRCRPCTTCASCDKCHGQGYEPIPRNELDPLVEQTPADEQDPLTEPTPADET